jgi:hypothetical protein
VKNSSLSTTAKHMGDLISNCTNFFDDVGMGDVTFPEGISTNIWAGFFTRIHKSAPGPFSPFLFSEMKAIGGDNNKDCSLLIKIFSSAERGLMKNMDKVKSPAKTMVTVPQDFHSFVYQLRAFAHALSFFFGNESILAIQLKEFWQISKKDTASPTKIELLPTTPLPLNFGRWTVLSNSSSKTAASVPTKRMATNE